MYRVQQHVQWHKAFLIATLVVLLLYHPTSSSEQTGCLMSKFLSLSIHRCVCKVSENSEEWLLYCLGAQHGVVTVLVHVINCWKHKKPSVYYRVGQRKALHSHIRGAGTSCLGLNFKPVQNYNLVDCKDIGYIAFCFLWSLLPFTIEPTTNGKLW